MLTGEMIGPYRVLEKVGEGGMGEVYKAHDTRLDRDVAIKVSTLAFNERFEREGRAVAALKHPKTTEPLSTHTFLLDSRDREDAGTIDSPAPDRSVIG
jgi:serine/threonine protein kinase